MSSIEESHPELEAQASPPPPWPVPRGTTYIVSPDRETITCLICRRTSHHPMDVSERYCGNCHVFHLQVQGMHKEGILGDFLHHQPELVKRIQAVMG